MKFFSIRVKLSGTLLLITLLMGMMGYMSTRSLSTIDVIFNEIIEGDVPHTQTLLEIKASASEIETHTISFQLLGEETAQQEGTPTANKKYELLASMEKLQKLIEKYKQYIDEEDQIEKEFAQKLITTQNNILGTAIEFINLKEQRIKDPAILNAKIQEISIAQDELKNDIEIELEKEIDELAEKKDEAHQASREIERNMLIALSVAIFTSLFVGILASGIITKPIVTIRNAAQEIARGNLDRKIQITSHDEVGDLAITFNDMASNLKETYQKLKDNNIKIEEKLSEVERLNKLMVGRELRMIELKKEITRLTEEKTG